MALSFLSVRTGMHNEYKIHYVLLVEMNGYQKDLVPHPHQH